MSVVPNASADDAKPAEAPSPSSSSDDEGGRATPQLIAACVALWLIAVVVFAFQAPGMAINYHLGNLRIALSESDRPRLNAEAEALISRGTAAVDAVREELLEPAEGGGWKPKKVDIPYRLTLLVEVIGRIPGPEATELILQHRADEDPAVRTNVYTVLGERVRDGLSGAEKAEEARRLLVEAVGKEPSPLARAFAARALVMLEPEQPQRLAAAWALLGCLRGIPPGLLGLSPPLVSALQQALGKDLPFDHTATWQQRDEQLLRFEEAYRAAGGVIPAGEDLETWRSKHPAPKLAAPQPQQPQPQPEGSAQASPAGAEVKSQ
ncbi:MAG: hypothetical protein AB7N76_32095 [Planctomycetota bacterium]